VAISRPTVIVASSDHFLGDASPIAYRLGVFGGGGTNVNAGREPGGLFVGRLELRPLGPIDDDIEGDLQRYATPRLALGIGVASNRNTNRLRSTTGNTFVGGTTDYWHTAADLVFKWRGWMVQGEYLWKGTSSNAIVSTDTTGATRTEATRAGDGFVVQTSFIFAQPFEIVGRYSRFRAKKGTDPLLLAEEKSRGEELVAGVNYYLNGHRLKIQANWIARMPVGLELQRADHLAHVQLDATF
jgi:phosphate-selective porin OprO and OprP